MQGKAYTYVLNNAATLPPVPINNVAAERPVVVQPAGVVSVQGASDFDVLAAPDATEQIECPLSAVLGHGVVVLVHIRSWSRVG